MKRHILSSVWGHELALTAILSVLLTAITCPQALAKRYRTVVLAQNSFDPSSGVTMIAAKMGFFRKAGLNVRLINLTAGKLALNAVLAGAADFATVAETPLVHAGLSGQKVVIVATTETSYDDVRLIARSYIQRVQDLRGKKVATAIGTNADYFLSLMLKRHGLAPDEVRIDNMSPQDMPVALANNSIAAYAVWEPFVYRGRVLLGDKAKTFHNGHMYLNYFNIGALSHYVSRHNRTVRRFIVALIYAARFINKHPRESSAIIARTIGMRPASFNHIWPDFHYKVSLEPALLQLLKKEAAWAIRSRTAPRNADVAVLEGMIVPGPFHAAMKQASQKRRRSGS